MRQFSGNGPNVEAETHSGKSAMDPAWTDEEVGALVRHYMEDRPLRQRRGLLRKRTVKSCHEKWAGVVKGIRGGGEGTGLSG